MNSNNVDTRITVDGKPCDFITMELDQRMAGHHRFEIAVNYRQKEQSVWDVTVEDIFKEMLGKPVDILMKHIDSGETNEFTGIVTDIEAVGMHGDQGTIILKGGSPTILLDRDPAMAAYVDYTLRNVVAETIENTGIEVELANNPALTRTIPYIARYKESSFAFLSRVLASFGEWFYYDGKKLVIGNPQNQKERRVTYDIELLEVRSAAGLLNLKTKYYDYDPAENNYFEEESATISNANLPMKGAKQIAEPLYPTVAKLPVGREVLGETDMSSVVRMKQSREYNKMSVFTASCNTCGVRIGEVATALLPESLGAKFIDLGSFRVLEVHHKVDKEGHYQNTFKGITSQTEVLPDDHIVMPQAFAEPATVVDNNDPKYQGRVKVRYFWQAEDASTNWIRVQTPDAGSSDVVAKNRGMVFIPEPEDQVMIGFLYGDPSRPYVMGSLFHMENSKGAAVENTIKTISTRSGHTIEFNDDEEGSWGITIKDRNGNVIHLDTAGKNIEITAPETMSLKAKNINIDADEDMSLSSGNNTNQNVGKDFTQSVSGKYKSDMEDSMDVSVTGEVTITMGSNMTHNVSGKTTQKAETVSITAEGGTASINAKDELTLKSAAEVIIAQ